MAPSLMHVWNTFITFADDDIIDTCSLLCRDLQSEIYRQRFRQVRIADVKRFNNLVRLPNASRSRISPYIRFLHLEEEPSSPWLCELPRAAPGEWFASATDLRIRGLRWDYSRRYETFHCVGEQFAGLESLTLSDCSFPSFESFQRLLSGFRPLRRLFIERARWPSPPDSDQHGSQPDFRVPDLLWFKSDCEGAVTALANWILRPQADQLGAVRDLKLGYSDGVQKKQDLPAIKSLTEALGSSLEHWDISIGEWTKDEFIDLSHTALRSLRVRHINSGSLEHLLLLLGSRISPAKLEDLELDLYISKLEELWALQDGWSQLDDVLARADYKALTWLKVWLCGPQTSSADLDLEQLVSKVRDWMPSLQSRSDLDFQIQVCPRLPPRDTSQSTPSSGARV